jgi:peptidoglycan-N-acetylglucosamine deacetylase
LLGAIALALVLRQDYSPSSVSLSRRFIFQDQSGKRWPRVRLALLLLLGAMLISSVLFIQALFVNPPLRLPPAVNYLKSQLRALQESSTQSSPALRPNLWQQYLDYSHRSYLSLSREAKLRREANILPIAPQRKIQAAFYLDGDPNGLNSLEKHSGQLSHLLPDGLFLTGAEGRFSNQVNPRIVAYAAARGLKLLPVLTNQEGAAWQPEAIENLARASALRQQAFGEKLITALTQMGAQGVVLDWQEMDPTYQAQYTVLLSRLAQSLHARDLQLWLCVQPSAELKTFDLAALSSVVDYFVAQLADENGERDSPGPIASQDWFEGWLRVCLGYGSPEQWIISLGVYGYDWGAPGQPAQTVGFADTMSRAARAQLPTCRSDEHALNPRFSYSEGEQQHHVWFLDLATLLNQYQAVRDENAGGIALNRLGLEDPSIWYGLLCAEDENFTAEEVSALSNVKSEETIANVGQGEFINLTLEQRDGQRTLLRNKQQKWISQYQQFPLYPTLYRQGEGTPFEVALTFDDGPDPQWTPQILDILKKKNVRATFFVTGRQAERYPELVRRIQREGHELGNHTYSHPNLALVSEEQVRLELNATQRILEAITGNSTTLFRPPYNADSSPRERRELEVLMIAQEQGYLTSCADIDPEDWARPPAEVILDRIKKNRSLGSVILLHDSGGNRAATVEALPRIIDYLFARGDEIVSLSRLLGVERAQLMPAISSEEAPYIRWITGSGFYFLHQIESFLWAFMIVATILFTLRTLLVAGLSLRFRAAPATTHFPSLSVLIAAYNEEKVITATIRSILNTNYPAPLEIIVIDDGSKDETYRFMESLAATDARIRLQQQANAGKALALRSALMLAQHEVVVFIDADTQLAPACLEALVAPLADAGVCAVSGHARVGNLHRFIARCQSLEYICGFNLDRRAYDVCNGITVLPGAISAVRKSAIAAGGGLSNDTLAEDTDLTLQLHRLGQRIAYAPAAVAYTEAPETIQTLSKQRFRWAFGTMQCLWKHRDLVFNPHYRWLGFFSLPSVWFFQILLVAIAPLIDLFLLLSLVTGGNSLLLIYFIGFLAMDLFLALLACRLEKEPLRQALLIIPMRFIYRPLLSWVIWRALFRAIKGGLVTWGKLERTANVTTKSIA